MKDKKGGGNEDYLEASLLRDKGCLDEKEKRNLKCENEKRMLT